MLINPQIDIALAAAGLSVLSQILQHKLMDRKEMKRKQEGLKEKQERIRELMKKNDQKSKNELDSLNQEMMDTMNAMMKSSMKLMVVSMVIFLPAFGLLGTYYGNAAIALPVPIPWFGGSFIMLYETTNWIGWYVLCSLVFSLGLSTILQAYEKMKSGGNAETK